MNNRKRIIIIIALLVAVVVCVCLCVRISNNNRQIHEAEIERNTPKIVHDVDGGSGVEVIDEIIDKNGKVKEADKLPTEAQDVKEVKSQPSNKKLSSKAQEYADYCAMSIEEQYEYYKTFRSADAFMKWYNKAKAAYEKENPSVVLEPGDAINPEGK